MKEKDRRIEILTEIKINSEREKTQYHKIIETFSESPVKKGKITSL